jgi:formate C-acetyltransferase
MTASTIVGKTDLGKLKAEILTPQPGAFRPDWFRSAGYRQAEKDIDPKHLTLIRAAAIYSLFTLPEPHIYENDIIVGSIRPLFVNITEDEGREAAGLVSKYPERNFFTRSDHYAPDFKTILTVGIPGLLKKISSSRKAHDGNTKAAELLDGMELALKGLTDRLKAYAKKAGEMAAEPGCDPENAARLNFIKENCLALTVSAPRSFAQGLQLVWMIHSCFLYEGRYAMALGRIDQYLYPLFIKDIDDGDITLNDATLMIANTFAKICESRIRGGDDVVNICIGGVDRDGKCAVNPLSYCVLRAVRDVNMPGPNLSARITPDTPDEFLDECLKVIGTGLGYPALMNDEANIPALLRYGYEPEDVRNYCMVGCIENFLPGQQPPWSDGRFDPIVYLEKLILEDPELEIAPGTTVRPSEVKTMDEFMKLYELMLVRGVKDYVDNANRLMHVDDPDASTSPFLSCFAEFCIERAKDINNGGSKYPSIHGAALMGVGTVSDSLAAIEKLVFNDHTVTLRELAAALRDNFSGHDELHRAALDAPKYGNNDDFTDKYAVWYTIRISEEFYKYHTYDGGGFYTAMAANVSNIHAGRSLGATPDGRLAGKPLSDAASPTYGCDRRGVTSTILSVSKPDYTCCACGTVLNQKFAPSAFSDGKREKLLQLIRVYFKRGGQEIQINSTSRETLIDAMEHPENYPALVVRVSGFSALYVTLAKEVQLDILSRTQHDEL